MSGGTVLGNVYKQFTDTTRYLWNSLPDTGCTTKTRERINHWAASTFLFSLRPDDAQLKREQAYYKQFWGEGRIPERRIDNQKIKNLYHLPKDKPYEVELPRGKGKVTWTCSLTQFKRESENVYNFVYIAGKDCTKDSTYVPTYPYLEGLAAQTIDVQYNFIFIAGFDISKNKQRYIPNTIEETGFLLQNVLCQISKEMGGIDQLACHSLGGIMFGPCLPYYKGADLDHFPKRVFFDRCPATMYGAASNVWWGPIPKGYFGYGIASLTGDWALNLGTIISDFEKANEFLFAEKGVTFTFADTMDDHYFSKTWLGLAKAVTQCSYKQFVTMQFRIPHGGLNPMAQHALPASEFYAGRIESGDLDFLEYGESLAEGIIRHSLKDRKESKKNV